MNFLKDAVDAKQEKREPKNFAYFDEALKGLSKEARTVVHKGCKKYLPCTCETEGFQADGIPAIKISFKGKFSGSQEGSCGRSLDSSGDKSYNDGRRKRKQWPEGLHDYLKFVMIKKNVDTMTAVNAISRHLKINPRNIAFSGNKDKRAVTVQWCTIFRKRPFDVHRINNMKFPLSFKYKDARIFGVKAFINKWYNYLFNLSASWILSRNI